MKTNTEPSTARLTPHAMAALVGIESTRPDMNRTKIVEEALLEAAKTPESFPMSEEEWIHIRFVHNYLIEIADTHSTGPKNIADDARQIALAAKTTARLLKRIFIEAKGRFVIAKT